MLTRVDVAPSVAHETEEGQPKLLRQLDGQRRGGADGDEDGNARHDTLLHDLERRAAADDENIGTVAGEEERSDHFVDGVVTADILARTQQNAVAGEGGSTMDY